MSFQPNSPTLLLTNLLDGQAPGLRYRIQGELVPVLQLWLDGTVSVFFEHYVVLWKDPSLDIGVHSVKDAIKHAVSGMPVVLAEARGPGEIALSSDREGHVFPLHLQQGHAIEVHEHQFLAATSNLEHSFTRQQSAPNMLFGYTSVFADRFAATTSEGVVWLHGYGNVFEKTLAPGEQIDVEPASWLYRDESVRMDRQIYGLRTGIFASDHQLFFNRFTGPGRIGIQSDSAV